jgi:tRNA nucleotidyltransferase (CCA-adding enzyme)
MDLITTHKNADFDAMSSVVAASKLYPGARLLLPGSQEKAVRNFLALTKDKIRFEDEKTCRFDDVTRLIIVDNRHRSRIGMAAELADKKDVEVHVYDHHPRMASDIKGSKDVFKEVGATVSIILEILDKQGKFDLSPLEATIMLLGIYEETGSLSFRTTTKLDVDMVSKLLDKGANLNAVSLYLNRELSGMELTTLIDLLETTEVSDINGINVAFAEIDAGRFDGEMGTVVHKLQEVENYPVLFAMFKSGERTKILARSRLELIDVNKILERFGGGGHSSAASARVTGLLPSAIRSEIKEMLKRITKPEISARDIMSFPVTIFNQEDKVYEVWEKLRSLGYKGAPVVNEEGTLVGMVTTGDLEKALKHDMGHSRLKGYMAQRLLTVSSDTPLHVLQRIMMDQDKGRIPVLDDGKLVGLVTRTDVLKRIHSAMFAKSTSERTRVSNLSSRMIKFLPKRLMALVKLMGAEADARGVNVFLVGGFVRDMVLGSKNYDLDVVVESDAMKFAKLIADKIGGSLVVHHKFGTATVVNDWPKWLGPPLNVAGKLKIDVATARKEVYDKPAALPTVEFSSLRDDLYRRDFTINAMAVNINKHNFGLFVDFFGGMSDIESKVVRILHDKSFIDDPTRIFRAVRFEQRFGFAMEKHTEYLIKHAIKQEMFRKTENQRIREELILILKEKNPEKAVFRMKDLHELRFIHPNLTVDKALAKRFDEVRIAVRWYESADIHKRRLDTWLMYLICMLDRLTAGEVQETLERFVFTRSETMRVMSFKEKGEAAVKRLSSRKEMALSEIYRLLEPFSHEATLCIMSKSASRLARARTRKFFADLNGARLRIKGEDIGKLGLKPGPRYKDVLEKVLFLKLDGKVKSRKDEVEAARRIISGIKP